MKAGHGVIVFVLLAAALTAHGQNEVNATEDDGTCVMSQKSAYCKKSVPGCVKGPFIKECDPEENCTQCCDAQCNLVTCNNCVGCKNQCHTGTIKKKTFYVDITCNLDRGLRHGMECIVCNCPEVWRGDIPECVMDTLKSDLMQKAVESEFCSQAERLDSLTLTCGDSTKNWKQIIASDPTVPKGYPYQCRNAESDKCIVSDRSFRNVKIKIEEGCDLSGGGPVCNEFEKIINTDCEKCKPGVEESSNTVRSGDVTETKTYCRKGNGFCTRVTKKCSVHFAEPHPCSKKCEHASKDGKCKYCKVGDKRKPRTPPLCVASLDAALYKGCKD
ncbi:hypothetical protein NDN08_000007 [Rhodosorus marinus]|uniref:Uncharacterized protein n=1 Tax=Rhodosorus marinus TaxID=101924 RepID=A0AAV8UGV2_9RHOD|nr:hypothetical protein NDN08_000007 [Rhodosorus marinus]